MKIINEQLQPIEEAINQENAEINSKIFRTMKTKIGVEPKYAEDLKALGITWEDKAHSSQGYWAVKGPNGKVLVISKSKSNNKLGIFDPHSSKGDRDNMQKIDYLNFLTMGEKEWDSKRYSGQNKPYFADKTYSRTYNPDEVGKDSRDFRDSKTDAAKNKPGGFSYDYNMRRIQKAEDEAEKALKDVGSAKDALKNTQANAEKYDAKAKDILARKRAQRNARSN